MARSVEEGGGDAHMEDLLDPGLGMEETEGRRHTPGPPLDTPSPRPSLDTPRPSPPQTCHTPSPPGPSPAAGFSSGARGSVASGGGEVCDRLTYLEQRMAMQEEELQVLKMALADVLQRLRLQEEIHTGRRARPASLSLSLPPKTSLLSPGSAPLKKSSALPPGPAARNYTISPTSTKSVVKSPTGSVKEKDVPCCSKTLRSRPSSASTSCKKDHDGGSKAKEPAVSVGSRRVTHCKVTMQISLSPLTRKTGSSEPVQTAPTVLNSRPTGPPTTTTVPNARPAGPPATTAPPQAKAAATNDRAKLDTCKKKRPAFALPLKKTTSYSPVDAANHKSPIKSPSQYFQICY